MRMTVAANVAFLKFTEDVPQHNSKCIRECFGRESLSHSVINYALDVKTHSSGALIASENLESLKKGLIREEALVS